MEGRNCSSYLIQLASHGAGYGGGILLNALNGRLDSPISVAAIGAVSFSAGSMLFEKRFTVLNQVEAAVTAFAFASMATVLPDFDASSVMHWTLIGIVLTEGLATVKRFQEASKRRYKSTNVYDAMVRESEDEEAWEESRKRYVNGQVVDDTTPVNNDQSKSKVKIKGYIDGKINGEVSSNRDGGRKERGDDEIDHPRLHDGGVAQWIRDVWYDVHQPIRPNYRNEVVYKSDNVVAVRTETGRINISLVHGSEGMYLPEALVGFDDVRKIVDTLDKYARKHGAKALITEFVRTRDGLYHTEFPDSNQN